MPCSTILLRSDNLTNSLMEGLESWSGEFEMCNRLVFSKTNVLRRVGFALMEMLRRPKLQGQSLPKSACVHHSEKIVVWGTRKQRDIKLSKKLITWTVLICFQEN